MRIRPFILCLLLLAATAFAGEPKSLILENALFRYAISSGARNAVFVDRTTSIEHLRATAPAPCALLRPRSQGHAATAVSTALL